MTISQEELTARIAALAEPLTASLGLSIWGIEAALGPKSLVRIYAEGQDGISIEECAELSRLLGLTLDVEELFGGAYVLEVSSPGLERIYFTEQQLATAVGNIIEVTLVTPKPSFPGRRKFRGMLAQRKNRVFSMLAEDCARPGEEIPVLEFLFEDAKKVRQVHFFPEKNLPGKPVGKKTKDKRKADNTVPEPSFVSTEVLRPLTKEEQELLEITGGSEAL